MDSVRQLQLRDELAFVGDKRYLTGKTPLQLAQKLISKDRGTLASTLDAYLMFAEQAKIQGIPHADRLLGPTNTVAKMMSGQGPVDPLRPLLPLVGVLMNAWPLIGATFGLVNSLVVSRLPHLAEVKIDDVAAEVERQLSGYYSTIRRTTTNPDIVGALLEHRVREIIREWVSPLRVSSGGILGAGRDRQIDIIVWDGHEAPAALADGDIAIVHPDGVKGVLEVRASDSNLKAFTK